MSDLTELTDYELRRNHAATPARSNAEAWAARSDLVRARRRDRRHRLAARFRAVADRLDS